MTRALFLGGPWNGRVIELSSLRQFVDVSAPVIHVDPFTPSVASALEQHVYRRTIVKDLDDEPFFVYVYTSGQKTPTLREHLGYREDTL